MSSPAPATTPDGSSEEIVGTTWKAWGREAVSVVKTGQMPCVWLALSAYQTAGAPAGNTNETFAEVSVTARTSVPGIVVAPLTRVKSGVSARSPVQKVPVTVHWTVAPACRALRPDRRAAVDGARGLASRPAPQERRSEAAGGGRGDRLPRAAGAVVRVADVPLHDGVLELIAQAVYAGGLRSNRDFLLPRLRGAGGSPDEVDQQDPRVLALFDPQTSGGLLVAVAADRHAALLSGLRESGVAGWTVGEVTAGSPGTLVLEG